MAKNNFYETPPAWFTNNPKNKDVDLRLEKNGWRAYYPSGRNELIVGMVNVPEEYWTINKGNKAKAPEVKPDPVAEVKVEEVEVKEETPEVKKEEAPAVEEQPKKKSRSKKQIVDE